MCGRNQALEMQKTEDAAKKSYKFNYRVDLNSRPLNQQFPSKKATPGHYLSRAESLIKAETREEMHAAMDEKVRYVHIAVGLLRKVKPASNGGPSQITNDIAILKAKESIHSVAVPSLGQVSVTFIAPRVKFVCLFRNLIGDEHFHW